ncbi:hypothetical protein HV819_02295 [Anaerococcus sp. AGMB00486]|uniref:Uncharacterized protein n=2 Tax=Anaerococcus TaxID=165779 RepID=A0ABX2N8H6_9FIRM|nr:MULTISPECIES: hypothetical protein [Anaerococcus]MSS77372.1 hypothetical protein [Anaerococcus porci]NVF10827.1 hypothetical protein [Anaerococcus faecalis]
MSIAFLRVITSNFVYRMYYKGEDLEDIMNSFSKVKNNEKLKAIIRKSVEIYIEENKFDLEIIKMKRLAGILKY